MSRPKSVVGKHHDSPLASNLRLLIDRQAEGSVNAWTSRLGLNQTTVNRIANGSNDASVSVVTRIADATGYAVWQLLHPDFDPRRVPPLHDPRAMRVAAIFSSITDERDRRRAEAIMEQFATESASAPAPLPAAPALSASRPSGRRPRAQ